MTESSHAIPQLARSRALAQMALIIAASCWIILLILVKFLPDYAWLLQILMLAAEAGVVGGLADWFAVTALFRHPLALPIPHTAIIPRRKDEIGAALDRVGAGAYGRCEDCGEPIGAERLEVLPATRQCVRCAARNQSRRW